MKLCLRAGGDAIANPNALLASMTRRQFLEWEAMYRLDPWDGERDDLLCGINSSAVAAAGGIRDMTPSDFMPDWLGTERGPLDSKAEHERKMDRVFARLEAMKDGNHNRAPGGKDKCSDGAA